MSGNTTPAAPADQNTPPPRIIDDPLLAVLAEDLTGIVATAKATDANEPPPIKPAPDTKTEDATANPAPAATTPPADAGVKGGVKKRVDLAKEIDDAFKRNLPPPPPPPAQSKQDPAPETLDTSGLIDAQIEELEDAKFLEQKDPAKKGFSKKLHEFYRSVDKWVADNKDDPDRTFDDKDVKFTEFLEKNKPKWDPGQRDRVRRDRIVEETKAKTLEEVKPQLEQANNLAREAKLGPIVERKITEATTEFENATKTEDPLEKDVFNRYRGAYSNLATDWVRLTDGLDSVQAPRDRDQAGRHAWLLEFVAREANEFNVKGGDAKVRDGRQFLHPAEYGKRKASGQDVSGHWTFTQSDVLNRLRDHVISDARIQIQEEERVATERGFVRQKPAAKTKTAEEPKPVQGIRATTTPAPGPADSSQNADLNHPGKDIISVLGLK